MTETQKYVILFFVFCIVGMLLVPPWAGHGYEPLFSVSPNKVIDWSRLFLQFLVALGISTGLFLTFGASRTEETALVKQNTMFRFFSIAVIALLVLSATWSLYLINKRNEEHQISLEKFRIKREEAAKAEQLIIHRRTTELQTEREEAAVHVAQRKMKVFKLAEPKRFPDIKEVCPGVTAIFQTSWQNHSLYYRLHLTGTVEALEYARAKSHRFKLVLFDAAKQPVYGELLDSRDFAKLKNPNGGVYSLSTPQYGRPMNESEYADLSGWQLILMRNRREVD